MTNPIRVFLEKKWEVYEQATWQVLNDIREYLGLSRVEQKQKIKGNISGTEWEVDLLAYDDKGEKPILVECRQRTNAKLSQEDLSGFAYRIKDAQATEGILVTTIGLQKGAKKVAEAEKIDVIKLDYNSTSENYVAQLTNQIFMKISERGTIREDFVVNIHHHLANGKVVTEKQ